MFSKEVAYEGVPDNEIVFYIKRGDKPQITSNIPPIIAQLITACWQQNPDDRPTFDEIAIRLYDELKSKIHFEDNPFGNFKSSPSWSESSTPSVNNVSRSNSGNNSNSGSPLSRTSPSLSENMKEITNEDQNSESSIVIRDECSIEDINKLIEGMNLNELLKLLETSKLKLKTYRDNKQRIINQLDVQQLEIDKEQKFQDNILQEILNNKP